MVWLKPVQLHSSNVKARKRKMLLLRDRCFLK